MLKGVNLGGWLVLEKWITPSLFEGLIAKDETSFCMELGETKNTKLQKHRREFITDEDFNWLATIGINTLRIPVPHWIFGDVEPYVGGIETLDWAIEYAKKNSLEVLLDIHTAPGSQNGYKHSGVEGKIAWHKDEGNINQSLGFVKKLVDRYTDSNLWGIELLNEPQSSMPRKILENYYQRGYETIRKTSGDSIAVVISDSFKPRNWQDFMSRSPYKNVYTDTHLYQCFSRQDQRLSLDEHITKAKTEWRGLLDEMQTYKPVIVGEWSLGLPAKAFEDMDENQKKEGAKAFADVQLDTFSRGVGWFFWTYKTENPNGWNFRHCIETGLLPGSF